MAVHEIGHALGLWHEQQRAIRDQYITVIDANVDANAKANFQATGKGATGVTDYGLPYDVNSVMHYSSQVRVASTPTV